MIFFRRNLVAGWMGLLALAAGLPACSSMATDEPPVADSTMVEVLIELHLAAARLDLRKDLPPAEREAILARHGLDTLRYGQVMAYYAEHPQAYVDLYSQVLDRLSAERAEHNSRWPTAAPRE